ncbi:phosphatase PAP2 family protein [Nocardia carnea]|uniref:phosphatase PAP2 family protein n=1 Tax=Nocardia carnea TaxID=37328 RepID=UPI0024560F53|nr:phosphatase PAP2 family protein [Nocardia carnea]
MSTAPGAPNPYPADRPTGDNLRPAGNRPGPPAHLSTATGNEPAGPHPDAAATPQTAGPVTTGVVATTAGAVAAALPWSFPPGGGPTTLDLAVGARVDPRLDPRPWVAEVLALATNTGVVLALLCGGAVWFAWQRRWWETATVILAPEVAVAVNTWALKPWWGRPLHDYLAYPSGHTVHLVSVITALILLLRSVRARAVIVSLATAAWCAAAAGMIALDYHHATDVIGGAAAGISLTIALYWTSVWIRRTFGPRPR